MTEKEKKVKDLEVEATEDEAEEGPAEPVVEKPKPRRRRKKKEEEPQPEKAEEVVEIPVDIDTFFAQIDVAVGALEVARGVLQGSTAYEDFVSELSTIQRLADNVADRIDQLHELEEVLSATRFTNKETVDAKVRKRVIGELTKHFDFRKKDNANNEDLVAIDDDVEIAPVSSHKRKKRQVPYVPGQDMASRDLSKDPAFRDEALAAARADMSLYEQAANSQYGLVGADLNAPGRSAQDFSELPDIPPDMSPEEIRRMFPDVDDATLRKVEYLKKLAPKKMGQTAGGITRRE